MITHFFEAANGFNWGKFAVGIFDDEEWARISRVNEGRPLLGSLGWAQRIPHIWVLDLQYGTLIVLMQRGD